MWLSSYLTICLNKLSSPTDRETEMSVKHKRVLWLGSLGTETKFQMKNKSNCVTEKDGRMALIRIDM
jgi:hypothetical protein